MAVPIRKMKVAEQHTKLKFIITLLFLQHTYVTGDKVVTTTSGVIRGITLPPPHSKVEAFLGVPFAEPPVGPLRFGKPVPKSPLEGTYVASSKAPPCIQVTVVEVLPVQAVPWLPDTQNVTEDCLYLNMWVPNIDEKSRLKSILVWIYGGAYVAGSSDLEVYDGAALAAREGIIVMNFNYRTGFLGMLTDFTEDAPGNQLFLDQIQAIKWMKENAKAFGGDPERITVSGHSAGSYSISGFLISPMARNLFKNGIMQTGSFLNPLFYDKNNERLKSMNNWYASIVGCSNSSFNLNTHPSFVISCLRTLSPDKLLEAESKIIRAKFFPYKVRIGDEFMPNVPDELYRNGDFQNMPVLVGVTKDEGTYFASGLLSAYAGYTSDDISSPIGESLMKRLIQFFANKLSISLPKAIVPFYKNFTTDTWSKTTQVLSNFIGDILLACPTMFHADYFSTRNPVYFYRFSHHSSFSLFPNWTGAIHGEEIPYVFKSAFAMHTTDFTPEEVELSERIMDRWAAFMENSNPNIPGATEWPMYSIDNPQYLDIDIMDKTGIAPLNRRCNIWREAYKIAHGNDIKNEH